MTTANLSPDLVTEITADQVTAVIVTRGDRDLSPILERMPFRDIVVWDNSKRSENLKVFGRFQAIQEAKNRVIYTQDDDCHVDVAGLLRHYQPGVIVSNMPPARQTMYNDGVTLIGWGAVFDAGLVAPLDRYLAEWPKDELFLRECDRIFTGLNRTKVVEVPFRHLEYGAGPGRMGAEDRHWDDLAEIRYRIGRLAGRPVKKRVRRPGGESMKPLLLLNHMVRQGLRAAGLDVKKLRTAEELLELEWEGNEDEWSTFRAAREYLMASPEYVLALIGAVQHICDHKIPGDFVQFGAWRGGKAMVMARTLLSMGETGRKIYLCGEFEGATSGRPDAAAHGTEAEVIRNICSTGFPREMIVTVRGASPREMAASLPPSIALLSLEADWHDSIQGQLECSFPAVARGGIVMLDGYSQQYGYKAAVDGYFAKLSTPTYLHRVCLNSRMLAKS